MIDLTARIDIVTGYRPGMIGRITQMHGEYYAKHYEFGHFFESKVASGLAEFSGRLEKPATGFGLPFRVSRLSDRWRLTARILVIMKRICAGLSSTIAAGEAVLADVC
jgi:hypothetical protein